MERLHPDSPHTDTGTQQKRPSDNHLALNGSQKPVHPPLPSMKQRVTISLPTGLIERLRNAVYWTGDSPLVSLVAEAIEDILTQMEEVNGGAFPQRVSPLKRVRRQGKCSPASTSETQDFVSPYPNR